MTAFFSQEFITTIAGMLIKPRRFSNSTHTLILILGLVLARNDIRVRVFRKSRVMCMKGWVGLGPAAVLL